jgi:acetyl esterase/lipase
MELKDEPRTNAKLLAFASQIGLDRNAPPKALEKLNENSTIDEIAEMIDEFETGIVGLYNNIPLDIPEDKTAIEIEREEKTIKGGDGQDMKIYIYRPKGQTETLSSVIYTHGGGMVLMPTMNPVHDRWCTTIAQQGVVVFMPDFRNAYNKEGKYNHFPAGLNDCIAAFKWVSDNRDSLKIRNIVLEGESGGCNLACATALKANREGWVDKIAGVYGIVPYISNAYGWPQERLLKELPSLIECNGYFLNTSANAFNAYFYTPTDEDHANPLAWPFHATEEDMKGLPPHLLVMDELDPLRDEGISYARRLAKAGVNARGSVNLGVVHGSSLILRIALPEYHLGACREIAAFAKNL